MPQFQYRALDGSGKPTQGTLDASSENDVVVRLSSQGMRVLAVQHASPVAASAPPPVVSKAVPVAVPQAVTSVRPVLAPNTESAPAPRRPGRIVRTKRASRMDLHFLFANMANLAQAGFGAAQMFEELSNRTQKPHMKQALHDLATGASVGDAVSDRMELYPDLFPAGAVGAVRAGETGGYLPEACQTLSNQCREDHKIAWMVRLMRWAIVCGCVCLPWAMAVTRASMVANDKIINSNSILTVGERLAILAEGFMQGMLGAAGIMLFVFVVGYVWLALAMKRTEKRRKRHELALKLPVIGRFARNESIAALAWHLGKLMTAGIHPSKAWSLAAAAMPNEALGEQARQTGLYANESTKLSEIAARSGVFPMDHQSLFFTGETSGSLPSALDHSSRLASTEMQHSRTYVKFVLYGTYLVIVSTLMGIAAVTFWSGFYESMVKAALRTD